MLHFAKTEAFWS